MTSDQRASTRAASNFFLDTAANLRVFGEAQRAELMLRTLADLFHAIGYGNLAVFNQEITRLGLFGPDEHGLAESVAAMLVSLAEAHKTDNPALAALYAQAADALIIPAPAQATLKSWSRSNGA